MKTAEAKIQGNEVTIEELDFSYKAAAKMKRDSEQKLEEICRRLDVMEVSTKSLELLNLHRTQQTRLMITSMIVMILFFSQKIKCRMSYSKQKREQIRLTKK